MNITHSSYDPFMDEDNQSRSSDSINTSSSIYNAYQRNNMIDFSDDSVLSMSKSNYRHSSGDFPDYNGYTRRSGTFEYHETPHHHDAREHRGSRGTPVNGANRANKGNKDIRGSNAFLKDLDPSYNKNAHNHTIKDTIFNMGKVLFFNNPVVDESHSVNSVPPFPSSSYKKRHTLSKIFKQIYLFILVFAYILIYGVDNFIGSTLILSMRYYWQLVPFLLLFICILFMWPIVLIRTCLTKQISRRMWRVSLWRYMLIGLFDAMYLTCMLNVADFINEPLRITAVHSIFMFTLILSTLFLDHRYKLSQFLGASTVIIGTSFLVIPKFMNNSDNKLSTWPTVAFTSLVVFGSFLGAISNCMKEYTLKRFHLDVWMLATWSLTFEIIFATIFFLFNFIPRDNGLTFASFPNFFVEGMKCIAGINPKVVFDNENHCLASWSILFVYAAVTLISIIISLNIMRKGSSSLASAASLGQISVASLLQLSNPEYRGGDIKLELIYPLVSLILFILGATLFNLQTVEKASPKDLFVKFKYTIQSLFFILTCRSIIRMSDENRNMEDSESGTVSTDQEERFPGFTEDFRNY